MNALERLTLRPLPIAISTSRASWAGDPSRNRLRLERESRNYQNPLASMAPQTAAAVMASESAAAARAMHKRMPSSSR